MPSGRPKGTYNDPKRKEEVKIKEDAAIEKFRKTIEEQLYAGTDPGVLSKRISAMANVMVRSETLWNIKRKLK